MCFRLAQSCSHVGGVLFALNGKERLKALTEASDESCTSKLCSWIAPRTGNQAPEPISSLKFTKSKPVLPEEPAKALFAYDPRHPKDQQLDTVHTLDQLKELKKIFPNTGLYYSNKVKQLYV